MAPHLVNRVRASGVHLLISICVAALSAALVFLVWYPYPLAQASGVTDIFLLVLVVDISLGPLITLFVFDLKKPELRRDLLIVGLIQLAALLYGIYTVYVARPAYVVFAGDRFDLVFANDLDEKKRSEARLPEFRRVPMFGPETIAAPMPTDPQERTTLMFESVNGGPDLYQLPKFYRPYADAKTSIVRHAQALEQLKAFNKERIAEVDSLSSKYRVKKADVGFVPLKGKIQDLSVVIDRTTGEVLEIVDLKPWL